MIGRRWLPPEYEAWNERWGAPYGRDRIWHRLAGRALPRLRPRITGPFGCQPDNSQTRRFEYPWAYHATPLHPGMRAVEIGGSLSGLQFVLSREGLEMINVDPSERASMGWPLDDAAFARLNRAFGTSVELRRCFLHEAGLADESVDRVFCISTLEHVPPPEIPRLVREIRRVLRPGGRCVLTIDLFLDLFPFTDRRENPSGRNVDVADVVAESGLRLIVGEPAELHGFSAFDPRRVQAGLADYLYGHTTPVVSQALVLEK